MEDVAYEIQQQGKMADHHPWIGSASAGVGSQWHYQLSVHPAAGCLQTLRMLTKMMFYFHHTQAVEESGSKGGSRNRQYRHSH